MTRQEIEQSARFTAAHHILRFVEQYGIEDGTAIMRGHLIAYIRALAAVEGWEAVLDILRASAPKPLGELSRPYIAVSNEAEIVHRGGAA